MVNCSHYTAGVFVPGPRHRLGRMPERRKAKCLLMHDAASCAAVWQRSRDDVAPKHKRVPSTMTEAHSLTERSNPPRGHPGKRAASVETARSALPRVRVIPGIDSELFRQFSECPAFLAGKPCGPCHVARGALQQGADVVVLELPDCLLLGGLKTDCR